MSDCQSPLPKSHPLLNAWERYQKTESFGNSRKWLSHDEHQMGSLWAIFMAGYQAAMAQSTCYVADKTAGPETIIFHNGRVVTLHPGDTDGKPYLEVSAVSVDGLGLRADLV